MQDPAASEMEFFVILVKGFWPSTSISKGSTCGIVGFVYTFWLLLIMFLIYKIENIHSY